jgi:hypothetical protein
VAGAGQDAFERTSIKLLVIDDKDPGSGAAGQGEILRERRGVAAV